MKDIATLEACLILMRLTISTLEEWLTDNTEKVFEEELVIDYVRCRLHDLADELKEAVSCATHHPST